MDKISIEIRCSNCVKAKVIPNDWYRCSITGKEWLIIGSNSLCKYWKPYVESVDVWIRRAQKSTKGGIMDIILRCDEVKVIGEGEIGRIKLTIMGAFEEDIINAWLNPGG